VTSSYQTRIPKLDIDKPYKATGTADFVGKPIPATIPMSRSSIISSHHVKISAEIERGLAEEAGDPTDRDGAECIQ
jgi:hypothetical protein